MTREEAIANLNMISVAFVEPVTKEQRKLIDDTFEMAIKALEQEPCEDAISREKTCDYIAEFINHEYSTQSECEMVEAMIDGIQHLPPVTPQPKTGHWINNHNGTYECDRCGKLHSRSKYCPTCGAKMVEPQESGTKMKCMECKHFERLKDGMRGGINGSCKLRNTSSYHDTRNGNQKACKTYFEPQERSDK